MPVAIALIVNLASVGTSEFSNFAKMRHISPLWILMDRDALLALGRDQVCAVNAKLTPQLTSML